MIAPLRLDTGPMPAHAARMNTEKRTQQVYTLVVEIGRKAGDGLPKKPPVPH